MLVNKTGSEPKINPINKNLQIFSYLKNAIFIKFPNRKIPINPPIANGSKYKKFFLKFLKIDEQAFKSLSYIPKITQNTPELTPGKIAPKPINKPTKIFFKNTAI